MICAIYLRKSRADVEAEARGEGETLARHEKTLMELARARDLTVTGIYRELVSGDTIADRPEMRRLLSAVERGEYDAILCMDIDRLGRGDGSDQAVILKTFKYSGTIIITPYKSYDTRTEIDEEYMEFAQFIARGELKRIKRRMWAGRVASAKEGKWQGKVPFGYRRIPVENGSGWTLTPEPSEAEVVRMIYRLYGTDGVGKDTIAQRINAMGYKTVDGRPFRAWSVRSILYNPVYIGKVTWGKRRKCVEMRNGAEVVTRPLSDDSVYADGLHEAIVLREDWDAVQMRLSSNKEAPLYRSRALQNPLSGLLVCEKCGYIMHLVPDTRQKVKAYYRCRTVGCPTVGIDCECVYAAVKDTLRKWVQVDPVDESTSGKNTSQSDAMYAAVKQQREQLTAQMSRLQDLLETGVYSAETYIERSKVLSDRIRSVDSELERIKKESNAQKNVDLSPLRPQIQHILDVWDSSSPAEKNVLLKRVIRKIVYKKTVHCTRSQNSADYLSLDFYPLL